MDEHLHVRIADKRVLIMSHREGMDSPRRENVGGFYKWIICRLPPFVT